MNTIYGHQEGKAVTGAAVGEKVGLDVQAHMFVEQIGTDAAEAGCTAYDVVATAHAAIRGDIIRFTSGALDGREFNVTAIPDANTIRTSHPMDSGAAAADTFEILRPRHPRIDQFGGAVITSSLVQFTQDGSTVTVNEDTVTPANDIPLPTKLMAAIPAGTNNIGDVDVASLPGTVEADIGAIKTAVETIDNAISGTEMQVDVVAALPAGTNNIGDVDVATLPGTVETDIAAIKTSVELIDNAISGAEMQVDVVGALPAGNNNIGDVDVASLPAIPAGTNNIGDVDVATLPGTVEADIAAIKTAVELIDNTVSGTELQVDVLTLPSLPAGTNNIGDVDVLTMPSPSGRSVVTTARNDYSSANVTTGAWVELVASLGSTVNEIEIFDSSGQTLEIGTGAAAAETRLLLVFPGGNGRVPVTIASGTRVSLRAVSATASSGEIDINFYA